MKRDKLIKHMDPYNLKTFVQLTSGPIEKS